MGLNGGWKIARLDGDMTNSDADMTNTDSTYNGIYRYMSKLRENHADRSNIRKLWFTRFWFDPKFLPSSGWPSKMLGTAIGICSHKAFLHADCVRLHNRGRIGLCE